MVFRSLQMVLDAHSCERVCKAVVARCWSRYTAGVPAAAAAELSSQPSNNRLPAGHHRAEQADGPHNLHGLAQQARSPPQHTSTTAEMLDGRRVAAAWSQELAMEARDLTAKLGRPPGLSVINVGSRPDSQLYITRKKESCQKAGISVQLHQLPESVSQEELEEQVSAVCNRPEIDAVLIQLPLPAGLDEDAVMECLLPEKDADGFHPVNMGRMLMRGRVPRLVPCTPLGVLELLKRSNVTIRNRIAVILGDSNTVGTPLAAMLRDQGAAAVTVCHRLSYSEWFADQDQVQRERAAAAACLPCLPGPSPARPPGLSTGDAAASGTRTSSGGGGDGHGGGGSGRLPRQHQGRQAAAAAMDGQFHAFQLPDITRSADILVVAVGHPALVRAGWVKPGAVVIDVGINVVPCDEPHDGDAASSGGGGCASSERGSSAGDDGGSSSPSCSQDKGSGANDHSGLGHNRAQQGHRVVGDVAFLEVSKVAGALTPVPGGVGPMTIAAVLHNTLKAAKMSLARRAA